MRGGLSSYGSDWDGFLRSSPRPWRLHALTKIVEILVRKRPETGLHLPVSRNQPLAERRQHRTAAAATAGTGACHRLVETGVQVREKQPCSPITHPHLPRRLRQ